MSRLDEPDRHAGAAFGAIYEREHRRHNARSLLGGHIQSLFQIARRALNNLRY